MTATAQPSQRRRFLAGLAAALLLGVGLGLVLLTRAQSAEVEQRRQREAVVTLRALTDLMERAGGGEQQPAAGSGFTADLPAAPPASAPQAPAEKPPEGGEGGGIRTAVERFAANHPDVKSIRVIALEGIQLDASTAPGDTGAKAVPRKLERDEKPLYDLAQRLRAAVAENRENASQGQSPFNDELSIQGLPDGSLVLSGPVERGGEVVGMVQLQTAPPAANAAKTAAPWGPALLAVLAPVALFSLLGFALGERRALLAAAAALLLVAALTLFGHQAWQSIASGRLATGKALAARIAEESRKVASVTGAASAASDSSRWDVDLFRRPRGLVSAAGTVEEKELDAGLRGDSIRLHRSLIVLGLLSLGLLAFVGLGGAARAVRDLVEHRQAYLYTMPALIAMLLLVFFPFFYGIALSFTNQNIYNTSKPITDLWVGLDNYKDILSNLSVIHRSANGNVVDYTDFYWTLGFTVLWTVSNVAIGVTLGLVLALILNTRGLAFRAWYRVLLILPWAMPNYITSLIFKGMFHQQFGVVNQLRMIVGLAPVAWFERPWTAFLAVLTTNGWLSFPFMMVVSLGALQSIPSDLYEAARVDGATRWQQFKSITLPSLKPALVPAVILSVIWTFNQFNVIYLVSAGEPSGSTEILITRAYKLAFEQYRYGYAAAYSTVIFLILLVYGVWQNRVTKATEGI